MGKQKTEPKPEDLDPLRERICAWRSTRRRPNPMPGEIWDHAVVLARQFGVCKVVYRNDAKAKQEQLDPQARLIFHQLESAPIMEGLERWLGAPFGSTTFQHLRASPGKR